MAQERVIDGKLKLTVPLELHRVLSDRADENRVSLNQICLALLAGAVGFELPEGA